MNIYAFTEPGSYPAYVSINRNGPGAFILTVRSQGDSKTGALGQDASIALSESQLIALANAIEKVRS